MRLKNKKTGEIVEVESLGHEKSLKEKFGYQVTLSWELDENLGTCKTYTSLAELNEDWEDVPEKPRTCWYLDCNGEPTEKSEIANYYNPAMKEIGNYFKTKEEAEQVVEKLKAWRRLRELGLFRWGSLNEVKAACDYRHYVGIERDFEIVFGGEE